MRNYSNNNLKNEKFAVLIVDDIPDNLQTLVSLILKNAPNAEIYQANSADLALDILSHKTTDIIITDWDMPGKSGLEMIEEIRQDKAYEDIPIIMCTGEMISSDNLATALEAGASDYIRKPVDEVELIARMYSMLGLKKSYMNIKALNEQKDTILSIIIHDLRGPVSYLNNLVNWVLEKEMSPDEIIDFFRMAKPEVNSSQTMLENLLLWAQNIRSGAVFSTTTFELHELVLDMIRFQEYNAKIKSIQIHLLENQTIRINADKAMISSVIKNILRNAIKFTNVNGNIEISSQLTPDSIEISIKDDGIGMSKTQIDSILSAKLVGSRAGTYMETGYGLGLNLSMEFIKKHKGSLDISSEEGKGSCFKITFPKELIYEQK